MAKAKSFAVRKPHAVRGGKPTARPVATAVVSIAAGLLVCIGLFAAFAALLTAAPIPLSAARPLACLGAAVGAAVSGYLMAKSMGRALLLCGLGSGVFYAVCVLLAGAITQGSLERQSADWLLPAALVLGGMFGGALVAVRGQR